MTLQNPTHSAVAILLGALLAASLWGCQEKSASAPETPASESDEPFRPAPESKLSDSSKLIFSDDFESPTLSAHWSRGKGEGGVGEWMLKDGGVVGVDLKNDPLWLDVELPEKVRIEFDIEALSSVGDLKVEVFGDGVNHQSGYVLIFGGWTNTLDVIARLDEHGKDRKARDTNGVMPGHTYRMAIERTDSTLNWFVNGKLFMNYEDPEPLVGEGHRHFALSLWSAPARYDNIKVYDLAP